MMKIIKCRYGSPTHWGEVWDQDAFVPIEDYDDPSGNDNGSVASDLSGSDESFLDEDDNFKIQFHSGNTAEALDKRKFTTTFDRRPQENWNISEDMWWQLDDDVKDAEKTLEQEMQQQFELQANANTAYFEDIVSWDSISSVRNTKK